MRADGGLQREGGHVEPPPACPQRLPEQVAAVAGGPQRHLLEEALDPVGKGQRPDEAERAPAAQPRERRARHVAHREGVQAPEHEEGGRGEGERARRAPAQQRPPFGARASPERQGPGHEKHGRHAEGADLRGEREAEAQARRGGTRGRGPLPEANGRPQHRTQHGRHPRVECRQGPVGQEGGREAPQRVGRHGRQVPEPPRGIPEQQPPQHRHENGGAARGEEIPAQAARTARPQHVGARPVPLRRSLADGGIDQPQRRREAPLGQHGRAGVERVIAVGPDERGGGDVGGLVGRVRLVPGGVGQQCRLQRAQAEHGDCAPPRRRDEVSRFSGLASGRPCALDAYGMQGEARSEATESVCPSEWS